MIYQKGHILGGYKLIDSFMRINYLLTFYQVINLTRYRLLNRYNKLDNITI